MKNLIAAWLLIFFEIVSLKTNAQKIEGIYSQDDFESIKLHIGKDLFLIEDQNIYEHLPPYNCSDTLAFGYWERDEHYPFIKLFTNPLQYANLIKMNVDESNSYNSDSVYFEIDNPIERTQFVFNKDGKKARKIYYSIYVVSNSVNDFDSKVNVLKFYSDKIALKAARNLEIRSFEITIYPSDPVLGWREDMPPIHVTSLKYDVKNANSNTFKIRMPELTYCYLSSLRFNGEFVKILNKNQLEWSGHIYAK